jgi:hypothetical protein
MADKEMPLKERAKSAGEQLSAVLDSVRVKLHLASMDAKDAWGHLEPQLKKVEEKLSDISLGFQNASDEADLQAHLAAMEARDRWDAISSDVGDVIRSMSGAGSPDAKEAFDHARLQAHLARLEAGEKVDEATKELKSKWSEVRHEAVQESSRFVERLGGTLEKLKEQLKQ